MVCCGNSNHHRKSVAAGYCEANENCHNRTYNTTRSHHVSLMIEATAFYASYKCDKQGCAANPPTRQNQPDPTQPNSLGWVGFQGLVGWVRLQFFFFFFFLQLVGLDLGHKIPKPPNPTRPTHIFKIYYIINNFF